MPKKRFYLAVLLFVLLLTGCGPDSSESKSPDFSANAKSFLYGLFTSEYLWYDQVPTDVDLSSFSDPNQMIDALRVNPPDRWSAALSMEEFEAFLNQESVGFGIGLTSNFEISFVLIGAPAYHKLYRGDKIIKINGKDISMSHLKNTAQKLNRPTTFTVARKGEILEVSVTPAKYQYQVTESQVIRHNNRNIGYLRYDEFSENSILELEEDFTRFKNANIQELIIDLRYNRGGTVTAASALLDNIIATHPGEKQFYLDWNENNKEKNSYYYFEDRSLQDGNELNMPRVFFLVTANSASASEAAINALIPYLGRHNVITIGDYTHGKPVGMRGRVFENHIYLLVNFIVRNRDGISTSFDGIAPTCRAADDITHRMGDTEEAMLSTALYYIDYGVCP